MLSDDFKAARRVSAPLVGVRTPDPAATIALLKDCVAADAPVIVWDVCRGWSPINDAGAEEVKRLCGTDAVGRTGLPTDSLMLAATLAPKSLLFMVNAHRYLSPDDRSPASAAVAQGIWNLRDQFKQDRRTLVLLGPELPLPSELQQDVLVLDEPYPNDSQLGDIVTGQVQNFDGLGAKVGPDVVGAAVQALRGLASYPAEQITAMACRPEGLDVPQLWRRKREMIRATPGLSVYEGPETFADVRGVRQIVEFLEALTTGNAPFGAVVFIDEIDKVLSAETNDSSGVASDQLGYMLKWMQDTGATGPLFIGPPGSAKSLVAKAMGRSAGIPTVELDLGGVKNSLVGSSEERLRTCTKVIDAVAGGAALVIATCNRISVLPPELRRRFTLGTWFFDLPSAEERAAIWQLYIERRQLAPLVPNAVDDSLWTGAEIKACCDLAWRLRRPIADVAGYIVPVAKAAPEQLASLRAMADGRFNSASHPGVYRSPGGFTGVAPAATARRTVGEEVLN